MMAATDGHELGPKLGDRLLGVRPRRRASSGALAATGVLVVGVAVLAWARTGSTAETVREPGALVWATPAALAAARPHSVALPRPGVEEAIARQQRELFELEPSRTPPCSLGTGPLPPVSAEIVRAHTREGIVIGTVATRELESMLLNFVGHAVPIVGECAVLVGLMRWTPPPGFTKRDRKRAARSGGVDEGAAESLVGAEPSRLERRLRAFGVGVYATGPTPTVEGSQAGRWRHAVALLEAAAQAGSHLLLSDADVVWLRSPTPYVRAALAEHGSLDMLISTDMTSDSDKPLKPLARMRAAPVDLQLEPAGTCAKSLNIGILLARADRPGALRLLRAAHEAVAARRAHDIDQGLINRRWKGNTTGREWRALRGHACPMLGGQATLGVLPAAQFLSLLGYTVRRLHEVRAVEPIGVHATFLRLQEPASKLMRLREAGLHIDPPEYYSDGYFLTYTPEVPRELLHQPRVARGAVPEVHMRLVHEQIAQLALALAAATALNRSLVLPRMRCACELGFGPGHVGPGCDADSAIRLPYDCAIDHWLKPRQFLESGFLHRERGFLDDPRVPDAVQRSRADPRRCSGRTPPGCCLSGARVPTDETLRAELGRCSARILDVGDARSFFAGFASPAQGAEFDRRFAATLSSWCCSTDAAFKPRGGLVPYVHRPIGGGSVDGVPQAEPVAGLSAVLATSGDSHLYTPSAAARRRQRR